MSATKEYLTKIESTAEAADLDLYSTVGSLKRLADLAWLGDHAIWAPSEDWLAETKHQLCLIRQYVEELESARDCVDYRGVTVNN